MYKKVNYYQRNGGKYDAPEGLLEFIEIENEEECKVAIS